MQTQEHGVIIFQITYHEILITTFPLSSSSDSIGSELIQLSSHTRSGAGNHSELSNKVFGSRKLRLPSTSLSQLPSSHFWPRIAKLSVFFLETQFHHSLHLVLIHLWYFAQKLWYWEIQLRVLQLLSFYHSQYR